jgi:hypothetical protein
MGGKRLGVPSAVTMAKAGEDLAAALSSAFVVQPIVHQGGLQWIELAHRPQIRLSAWALADHS